MLFINLALIAGLAAIAVPVVIHLLNRRTARIVDWGAMRFLVESMTSRRRRIQLEEALLMAARCLVFALIVLAVARPFVPPGSRVPWVVVLPLGLAAVAAFGVAVALWSNRRWRWIFLGGALGMLALAAGGVLFEQRLALDRLGVGERRDVALVIDGSSSMGLTIDGVSNFERAVGEARAIIEGSPRGDAFSLVLGGAVPAARIPAPTSNRADLLAALAELAPAEGSMAAYEAVTRAALGLAEGYHANKQIVVITDGQSLGWDADRPARWEAMKAGFATLPNPPRVIVRRLPPPASIRNAAVSGVRVGRRVVGTARPVAIEVDVENPGDEAVTPTAVELVIGEGTVLRDESLGRLLPGARRTVRFEHRFETPGAVAVEARLAVRDDLAADDAMPLAVQVTGTLGVLLVDGRPSARPLEGAAAFTALALAPGFIETAREGVGERRFLVEPEVVPVQRFAQVTGLSDYRVVVLNDVPRLPAEAARRLAQYVRAGGGLLIAPGGSAEPAFYNGWTAPGGRHVLPGPLVERIVPGEAVAAPGDEDDAGDDDDPAGFSLASFTHPALAILAEPTESDLGTVSVGAYWRIGGLDQPSGEVGAGARLDRGDVLLAEHRLGNGSVLLMAVPLDNRWSNLGTRQGFVPLVHELTYYLSNPGGLALNLDPSWGIALNLSPGRATRFGGSGLTGHYFRDAGLTARAFTRVDPTIDFDWGQGAPGEGLPADGFSVRWQGTLTPRFTERHEFGVDADDALDVWIDGRHVVRRNAGGAVDLEAGRAYPVRIEFTEQGGHAKARLLWNSPSQPWGVIAPDVFSPVSGGGGGDELLDRFAVEAPDGTRRELAVFLTDGGLVGRLVGDVAPGLHRVVVPEARRLDYPMLTDAAGTIPFTVIRDPAESRMDVLTDEEFDRIGTFVEVLLPGSAEEVLGILEGREFGRELWRYLAAALLVLLLAEVLLARWISKGRAVDEDEGGGIDFVPRGRSGAGFHEQLARLRGARAETAAAAPRASNP